MQQTILEWTRTIVALAFLFYASWSDHKTREVSNRVWALFAPIAFALTFCELCVFDFSNLSFYGLCFGLTTVFAVALFYSGGFGGADSKALMCLALAIPFAPTDLPKLSHLEISPISQIFFPVTIFSNSVLLAAFTAVIIFVYNIFWRLRTGNKLFEGDQRSESFGKKILILITGYKVPIDKLKEKWHIYPLEDLEESDEKGTRRKLIVVPRDEGRTATVERLDKAVQAGAIQDRIWASPGLPMLIFVTAGLIIALLFGDIVWVGVRFLLH